MHTEKTIKMNEYKLTEPKRGGTPKKSVQNMHIGLPGKRRERKDQ